VASLKERVSQLETDLRAAPMRHYVYSDLPFAIFCYRPEQEWEMRSQIRLLKTRIENDRIRQVTTISLADLLWESIETSEGLNAVRSLERDEGFPAAQTQVNRYLSDRDWSPLCELLKAPLDRLSPQTHLAFIVRAGALAPNVYSRSINCSIFYRTMTHADGYPTFSEVSRRKSTSTKLKRCDRLILRFISP